MPLYIRDDAVAALARQAKEVTGAKTVTEVVRVALEREIEHANRRTPFRERIAGAMAIADAMGPSDHSVDMKRFMDELSGE